MIQISPCTFPLAIRYFRNFNTCLSVIIGSKMLSYDPRNETSLKMFGAGQMSQQACHQD